jgi:hypothetical protein
MAALGVVAVVASQPRLVVAQGAIGSAPLPGGALTEAPSSAPLGQAPASAPGAAGAGDANMPQSSLQSQLGAIPLISPRATQRQVLRTVRVTQLGTDLKPMGPPREMACPESGCQHVVQLKVDQERLSFLADIQFVAQGAYLSLQPRSIAIGSVREFSTGRSGPVFLKAAANQGVDKQVRFVTAPSESVRRLEGPGDPRTVASGQTVTRKRDADVILKVEILP